MRYVVNSKESKSIKRSRSEVTVDKLQQMIWQQNSVFTVIKRLYKNYTIVSRTIFSSTSPVTSSLSHLTSTSSKY